MDSEKIRLGEHSAHQVPPPQTESWKARLTLVKCWRNLGYAGGMNAGIWYANATYWKGSYLLLNNDVTLRDGFLRERDAGARKHPFSAIVQGKTRQYHDRARLDSAWNEMDMIGGTRCRGYGGDWQRSI